MNPQAAQQHVVELALMAKEYSLAEGERRESMRAALAAEVQAIRDLHGADALQAILRRVEATMNGSRFPDV